MTPIFDFKKEWGKLDSDLDFIIDNMITDPSEDPDSDAHKLKGLLQYYINKIEGEWDV